MSHSTVLVIGNDPELQLAPFDEDIDVTPYNQDCYCITRSADARAEAAYGKSWKDLGDEFRKSKQPDEKWNAFTAPLRELEATERAKGIPKPDCDDCKGSGTVETTYNPKSKWDWYDLGGRWSGSLKTKDGNTCNQAKKGDVVWQPDFHTFAVLKDGQWHEKGDMGWFGMVSDEKPDEDWQKQFTDLMSDVPDDTLVSVYDVHI